MTDHPTIEDLSAYVDGRDPLGPSGPLSGQSGPSGPLSGQSRPSGDQRDGHIGGCAQCRSTVAALRSARAAVAVPPVPLGDTAREDAIGRAVAAGGAGAAGSFRPDREGTYLKSAGGSPAAVDLDEVRKRRWTVAVAVGSVAAMLFTVLAAVAVVRSGDSDGGNTTFAGPELEENDDTKALKTLVEVRQGGDLGDIADAGTLATRVAAGSPAPAAGSRPPAQIQGRTATADPATESAADSDAEASSPAAPTPGAPPVAAQVGTRPCEIEIRLLNQTLGPLLYYATARWQGTPAVVLGFSPTPAPPDQAPVTSPQSLFVIAQDDCRPLAQATTP